MVDDLPVAAILNPWRLSRFVSAARAPVVDVSFESGGRELHALVPSSELWVAVKDVLVLEDYELDPQFRFSLLPAGSTVVDAGAFVGLFSLKVSPYAKRVIALEPSRLNFGMLVGNLAANHADNVEPRRMALSDSKGTASFRDGGTSSSVVDSASRLAYSVETETLENVLGELGHADLLKMDIEGAEYDVLASAGVATLRSVDRLVAEIHFREDSDRRRALDLRHALESSGMRVTLFEMPRREAGYGLAKPWRCSLRKFNGRSTVPYRVLISAAYGLGGLAATLKSSFDVGGTSMLFASRT